MNATNLKKETPDRCPRRAPLTRACTRLFVRMLPAALLLLAGCSKEPMEGTGSPGDSGTMEISFTSGSMVAIEVGTRALTDVDENTVKDLWVIQLNNSGTAQLVPPQYFSGNNVTSSAGKYTVKANIKAENSQLYFIANTDNATLYNGATTSDLVKSKTLTVTDEASLAPGKLVPMSGYFEGTPTAANMQQNTLTRAVAKLTFKLAADIPGGGSFTLKSVKVHNVPNALHLWRHPDQLDPGTNVGNCYPSNTPGFIDQWMDWTPSDKTLSASPKDMGSCYLPENGRGTGSATDQTQKTAATALTGQGDYATYIEIRGDYTTGYGYAYTDNTYRIYLGEDMVKDYNVKRNTDYIVEATINGLNSIDGRITFGNVTPPVDPDFFDYTENMTGWFIYAKTDVNNNATMKWVPALTACPSGWRLPTLTEAEIISCMRDTWETTSNGLSSGYYWSATENSTGSNYAWSVHLGSGAVYSTDKASDNRRVRCVRGL